MNKSSIQQALTGLLPTLNEPLPPELLQLALSLLTRSQSVATSLKPDEEIARPYACAQIACERLKKRHNLPSITSRPPCPPRIYKKLYSYLSSALPAPTSNREPQTPRKNPPSAPTSARNTPKTPMSGKKTPRSTHSDDRQRAEVHDWVMPTIRILSKALSYPPAAPHIFSGVQSILPLLTRMSVAAPETPSKRARRPTILQPSSVDVAETHILALITVLTLYVLARMKDENVVPDQYNEWQHTAVATLLDLPVGKDVARAELVEATEQMMPLAQKEGWLQMEWFVNVTPQGEGDELGDEMEGVEMTSRSVGGKGRAGGSEYIGLGTMMQDATDFLGERKQEEYERWKAGIMERVREIEAS